ncbi:hypothetical protein CLV88_10180 [Shimia abyssi]|uniref:Lipoprotein n=1 Tax=Shimia abyssi TaxID=1662395 RepID=A0A2P8FIW9_9RHOB|nr:hypothetical protein CLV88_10180 [Shimia abyssi]
MKRSVKNLLRAVSLITVGGFVLAGCDSTGGSVYTGAYYDSMMWNDYYRPYPPPNNRPPRPEHPIERPPERPVHPIAPRPPVSRPTPRPSPPSRPAPRPSPRR